MKHKLIDYFSTLASLSADEAAALTSSIVTKSVKQGNFLLKAGQLHDESYFVLEGCVRQYRIVDGEEITINFFTENQWIISLNCFSEKTASADYLLCLEDTTMVVGNEQKAQALFKHFPKFETISRVVMEHVFGEQREMMTAYLTSTPEQRYLKLLKERPDLFQRVPQYQIASYLGVKPESLSRIRKRMTRQL